jgi:hypothetical protein
MNEPALAVLKTHTRASFRSGVRMNYWRVKKGRHSLQAPCT